MTESQKKNETDNNEKFTFIQEQIIPKRKSKIKVVVMLLIKTLIVAVVFGVVSSFIFCLSGSYFSKLFSKEKGKKPISFTEPTVEPTPSIEPSTLVPESQKPVTEVPSSTKVPEYTKKPEVPKRPEATKKPSEINQSGTGSESYVEESEKITLKDYSKMYALVSKMANQVEKSIVTVSSVISGTDWLNNPSETTDESYGLVIANNEKELLILATKNKIEDANQVRVTFSDKFTVEASLYGYDSNVGIAIIAVELEHIPEDILDLIEVADLGGESYHLSSGTPVVALGNPTGYMYSMMMGMITGESYDEYITDYRLDLFNTDIPNNTKGEGIIVNLNGQIVGVITHNFEDELNKDVTTMIGISRLRTIIEKIVNHEERIYFGVVASDITEEYAKKHHIENGIYVTEVKAKSPAFDAGVQVGDIIIKIDDTRIANVNLFYNTLESYEEKDMVSVKVLRTANEEYLKLEVELGAREH